MSQYSLPLALPPLYCADNFFVSDCNREAWQWVNAWPGWPSHALIIYGPPGSGKSHLGAIWAGLANAITFPFPLVGEGELLLENYPSPGATRHPEWLKNDIRMSFFQPFSPQGEKENFLIENIEQLTDERELLHLFNYTRENKQSLLLTSAVAPAQLPFTLPDLTSRLLALPCAAIRPPDDEAIAGVLRKQFTDRQMKVEDGVIAYILPRIERSLGKVKELVEILDKTALAQRKNITVPFVKKFIPA